MNVTQTEQRRQHSRRNRSFNTRTDDRPGSRRQVVNPQAGVVLNAVQALKDETQETFTREQVAFLVDLAFRTGTQHRNMFDRAEMIASWDAHSIPRQTRQMRIDAEMRRYVADEEHRQLVEREWPVPRHTFADVEKWTAAEWLVNRHSLRRSRQTVLLEEPWPAVAALGGGK